MIPLGLGVRIHNGPVIDSGIATETCVINPALQDRSGQDAATSSVQSNLYARHYGHCTRRSNKRVQHLMPTESTSTESPAAKPPDPSSPQNALQDPGTPSFLQRFWLPAAVVLGSITLVAVTGYEVLSVIRLLTESHN